MRIKTYIKCFVVVMLGLTGNMLAQAPQLINYQGVARNSSGVALSNTPLSLTISISNSSSYSEIHSVTSNAVGIFTLHIGGGSPLSGSFASLDWSVNPTNLSVSIDDGTGPVSFGPQQLVSVPYALYAQKAAAADLSFTSGVLSVGSSTVLIPAASYTAGTGIAIGSGTITNTAPDQVVTITPGSNVTVTGAYPSFTIASSGTLTSTPNTSVTGTGAATVTSTGTNTFDIAVAQPTLTGTGSTTVSGSFPSYTISTPISSSSGSDWSLLGNAGTIDGTNFIGTTDNVALNFRVNNLKAGRLDPTGPTLFGTQAGNSNTDPGATAYGYKALFSNTSGANNSAFGNSALTANTTGVGNTSFGYKALQANTTANYNTAVGFNALFNQSFSNGNTPYNTENVAVGHEAMYSAQPTASNTGVNNTAVGSYALHNTTTGYQNNAFGYEALYANTTGINNIAIGNYALLNTNAQNNIGIGYFAMASNPNGVFNVAIGGQVMNLVSGGSDNTVIGWAAGTGTTGSSYSNNTIIGANAGYNLTTGSGNVFIGNQAGYPETNGSNRLYIANNSSSPLIFGDFAAGKVGIGTTSPATALHVNGPVTITDGSQNLGYVLTSDAAGTATWQKPVAYTVAGVANTSLANVNTTPAMFPSTVPFTKQYANSTIEIMCTMDVSVSSMAANGVIIEIMIDGVPSLGNAKSVYFSSSVGTNENLTIIGVFPGITAGAHNVQFYGYTLLGTGTTVILNSGGWVPQLVIKEN